MILSRPPKLSHGQTVLYEIDMLRFSAGRLRGKVSEEDQWVYLEDFLLHYRNLIDFLGHDDPRKTDLHITDPRFLEGGAANIDVVRELKAAGTRLWANPDTGSDIIAKYLHHCTTRRIEDKSWPIGTMNDGLEKLLSELEPLLAHVGRPWRRQPSVQFLGHASMSTTSY